MARPGADLTPHPPGTGAERRLTRPRPDLNAPQLSGDSWISLINTSVDANGEKRVLSWLLGYWLWAR